MPSNCTWVVSQSWNSPIFQTKLQLPFILSPFVSLASWEPVQSRLSFHNSLTTVQQRKTNENSENRFQILPRIVGSEFTLQSSSIIEVSNYSKCASGCQQDEINAMPSRSTGDETWKKRQLERLASRLCEGQKVPARTKSEHESGPDSACFYTEFTRWGVFTLSQSLY